MSRRASLALAVIAASAAACAMIGDVTEETTKASGVALVAYLLGPLYAVLSWPIWDTIGDWLASWLSGTTEQRVPTTDRPASQILQTTRQIGGSSSMLEIILYAAIAYVLLSGAGLAWLKRQLAVRDSIDNKWEKQVYNKHLQEIHDRLEALDKKKATKYRLDDDE